MYTSGQPLRILHLMSGFGGGISSFVMNKAREMAQYHTVFDVALYDDVNEEFAEAIHSTGGQIYQLQNPKKKGWQAFKQSVLAPLNAHQYDIIHCHVEGYRMLPLYWLCKRYSNAKFYIHAHTVHREKGERFVKSRHAFNVRLNRRASEKPVGCGLRAIESVFGEAHAEDVLPNSIDQNAFQLTDEQWQTLRNQYRQKYQISNDTLLIGHVGRLNPIKNHQKTIEIAKALKEQHVNAKILIIGAGQLAEKLEQQIQDEKLTDYAMLTGRISPISELYPALDAMILPSFTEGLPTTVIESQAAGLPMLMSDTITDEVDLGLGLVATLALDESADTWATKLVELSKGSYPDLNTRLKVLDATGYTNRAAGKLYVNYFLKELDKEGFATT